MSILNELKTFSQESLSLLLTGGNTGVAIEHHIPIATSFGDSPVDVLSELDNRMPRLNSAQSLFSTASDPVYCTSGSTSSNVTNSATTLGTLQGTTDVCAGYNEITTDGEVRVDELPGPFNFSLKFEEKEQYPKNFPYCYCKEKDTLIAKDHTAIPFTFTGNCDLRGLRVKIMAVYGSKEHFATPVKPCFNHQGSSQGQNQEFLRCVNQNALDQLTYGRHCVYLGLDHCRDVSADMAGTELVENFVFNCRSSCSTKSSRSGKGARGISNRQISLIFQLERYDGSVMGRRVVTLKVSVSPGRDIATLLNKRPRKRSSLSEPGEEQRPSKTPRKSVGPTVGTGKYNVVVNSKEALRFAQKLANALDFQFDAKHDQAEWAEYMGNEYAIQSSVATQENGSQPDHYSLSGWLSRYSLESYAVRLEQNGFDTPQKFQCLSDGDLDDLGIVDGCHRMTLLHAAKRILLRGIQNIVKNEIERE